MAFEECLSVYLLIIIVLYYMFCPRIKVYKALIIKLRFDFFSLFIYMSGFTGLNIKKYLYSSPKVGL